MALGNRQKVVMTLIIIAVGFIAWQVYELFGGEQFTVTPTHIPEVPRTITQMRPQPTQKVLPTIHKRPELTASGAPATIKPATFTRATQFEVTPTGVTERTALSQDQSQYLHLVNQYQIVKMQRMLVEEEAAIAAAKQKISKIDKETGIVSGTLTDTPTAEQISPTSGYKLMYLDFQSGKWTATIRIAGRFQEVANGTHMIDGSKVINIDKRGVVMQKGDVVRLLTFAGSARIKYVPLTHPKKMSHADKNIKKITQPIIHIQPEHMASTQLTEMEHKRAVKKLMALLASATKPTPLRTIQPHVSLPQHKSLALNQKQEHSLNPLKSILDKEQTLNTNLQTPSEKKLLSANKNDYTIQMMGSRNPEVIKAFIKANKLSNGMYFHTTYLNKKWYVLVLGIYQSYRQAQLAVDTLPPNLSALTPWVRPIRSVQRAIQSKQEIG